MPVPPGVKDSTPGADGSGVSMIGRGGAGMSSGFTDTLVVARVGSLP